MKNQELSKKIAEIVRVDHAGECGAQVIYQGQIMAMKLKNFFFNNSQNIAIIESMKDQEVEHFKYFDNLLKENNFLDDRRFVEAYVQGKLRIKKWGRQKIKAALFQKRIDTKLIQEGIYAFISDEEYQGVIESLIERKNRELSSEKNPQIKKQKLMRFLLSRGFQYDEFSSLKLD